MPPHRIVATEGRGAASTPALTAGGACRPLTAVSASGDAFLRGTYLEVGVSGLYATFGSRFAVAAIAAIAAVCV